ncbi:MAG: hypothetical protein HC886_08380 [Leptolyngbyaceae cyanobacterium SM1_1_3]|nr:hypothetical protein [Leptolyngbyaceae cyanobacterium SM1_1_3]
MVHKHLIVSLALGISLAANSALQARGLPVPAAPPLRLAQLAETYDTYIEDSTFSIDYPSGWRIERVGDQYLRLMNYDPIALAAALSDKIKTEVWLIDESPAVVVERELDELQAEEAQVNRYRVVTVDQQSGIRIWLGGLVYDFPTPLKPLSATAIAKL